MIADNILFKKIIILLLFITLNSSFLYSLEQNTEKIELIQLSKADQLENQFDLFKNDLKEINFKVSFDSKNTFEKKVIYSYEVLSNNFNENKVSLDLSKKEEYFFKNLNSNLQLKVLTKEFSESSFVLKIEAKVYDNYNNLIDYTRTYLSFQANNKDLKNTDYFNGFNYSRSLALIEHKNDFDVIKITTKNKGYDLYCKSDNPALETNINYPQKEGEFDLNISVDKNYSFLENRSVVSCYAFTATDKIKLKDIVVIYENREIEFLEEEKTNKIDLTTLLSFTKNTNKNILTLVFIFVLFLFFLSLSKKK
ncbi:MAG: hypothetical protein PHX33_07205 [Candidatus Cloacimonetes bacterium]|nr:hypothetical protein [Candidatus Cloacimonadota bacterium]